VESSDGYAMPAGCFVGVRVGDVLKQGRYEPSRCYHFPAPDRRRNAKIDVYRHIGSCFIPVDPEAKFSNEVRVASLDPSVAEMRLRVDVSAGSAESIKQREARSKQVRNQAKDYLGKHNVEEKLSEAVKALLKDQPADPTEFLCTFLRASADAEKGRTAPQNAPTPSAPQKSGPAPQIVPFSAYYKSHMAPRSTQDFWNKLHGKFPARAVAKVSSSSAASAALEGTSAQKFVHKPSVGTWLASAPRSARQLASGVAGGSTPDESRCFTNGTLRKESINNDPDFSRSRIGGSKATSAPNAASAAGSSAPGTIVAGLAEAALAASKINLLVAAGLAETAAAVAGSMPAEPKGAQEIGPDPGVAKGLARAAQAIAGSHPKVAVGLVTASIMSSKASARARERK